MRSIGTFNSTLEAERFAHVLRAHDIEVELENDSGEAVDVWILDEDQLEQAGSLLQSYQQDPQQSAICDAAAEGQRLLHQDEVREKKRAMDGRIQQAGYQISGIPVFTLSMMIISIILYLMHGTEQGQRLYADLLISSWEPKFPGAWFSALVEVRSGQVWRLVTPIFLHFGLLHILFNMIWLLDLGRSIELRKGSLFFALFVLTVAIPSNLLQFAFSGPAFGGMSGVVYGMLGYVFMKSTFAPREGFVLHRNTMIFMLIWLGLGFLNATVVRMANLVHLAGLLIGVVWGYVTSVRPFWRAR